MTSRGVRTGSFPTIMQRWSECRRTRSQTFPILKEHGDHLNEVGVQLIERFSLRVGAGEARDVPHVRECRRRWRNPSGAVRWGLWRDLELPTTDAEQFVIPSWCEHLCEHKRVTANDDAVQEAVRSYHVGDVPASVRQFSNEGGR